MPIMLEDAANKRQNIFYTIFIFIFFIRKNLLICVLTKLTKFVNKCCTVSLLTYTVPHCTKSIRDWVA